MAKRIAGITIEIGGDTTKLKKALQGVDSQLSKTGSNLKDIGNLLKMDPGNATLLEQKQRNLSDAIGETKLRLRELKSVQKESLTTEEWDALQREIIDTEQKLKGLEKEYRGFGSVGAQQVAAVGQTLEKAGAKVTDAGKKLTKTVTVAAVAGLGSVIQTGMEFDAEMSKVKAISGATGEEFEQLRSKARELGSTTKFSATESAEAFEYMAMAGWKPQQMLEGIGGVLSLAAASGEDLGTTSDIVTDALTALKLEAKDTGKFVDILAAASSSSNTNVSMMGESFKYAAPLVGTMFAETGTQAEDTAIALGLMANAGIKASQGGTALRRVLTNMASPTASMSKAMDALGVSLDDGKGNMYSLYEVMVQLRSGFGGLMDAAPNFIEDLAELDQQLEDGTITEDEYAAAQEELISSTYDAEAAEKARYAAMLAGKTGLSGLLAIVNASPEEFDSLTESIYGSEGAAQAMADTMQDNTQGDVTKLKSAIQELSISLSDTLTPVIRQGIEIAQDLVDKFNSLDDDQKKTIVTVGLLAAAAGPVLVIGGTMISGLGKILTLVPTLVSGIGMVTSVLGGPLTLALAAAVAGGVLLIKNWDKVKEVASTAFNGAKNTISNAINSIKGLFNFSWSFPKLKMPHFSWTWQSVGGLVSIPMISVDWYAKAMENGMILNKPTIFGAQGGRLLGGGESGSEAVVGTSSLMAMIRSAVMGSQQPVINVYGAQGQDIRELANIVMQKMEHRVQQREGALT